MMAEAGGAEGGFDTVSGKGDGCVIGKFSTRDAAVANKMRPRASGESVAFRLRL